MEKKVNQTENKRVFMGSWFLVISPFFVAAIQLWYHSSKYQHLHLDASTIDAILATLKSKIQIFIYLIGGSAFYYFASRIPIKLAIMRAEKSQDSDGPNLFNTIFQDSFKGGTVKYDVYNSAGSYQNSEEYYVPGIAVGLVGIPIKFLVYFIILFIKASFVPYWGLFNFFRNYIFFWLFSKKYREFTPKEQTYHK